MCFVLLLLFWMVFVYFFRLKQLVVKVDYCLFFFWGGGGREYCIFLGGGLCGYVQWSLAFRKGGMFS